MSGPEVVGLISGIITIIATIEQLYSGFKDGANAPPAFQNVANRLPLVRTLLESVKSHHPANSSEETIKIVQSCEAKAEKLKRIFEAVSPSDSQDTALRRYRTIARTLGKGTRVEKLAKSMMEDLDLLSANSAVRSASEANVEELRKAIEELASVEPSISDDEATIAQTHLGRGDNVAGNKYRGNHNEFSGSGSAFFGTVNQTVVKQSKFREHLRITDPEFDMQRIMDSKGGLLREAFHWILDHRDFTRWQASDENQVLWISGWPGKGKTMLLCGIIEELKTRPDKTLRPVYYFCENGIAGHDTGTAVLRGLLSMIIDQHSDLGTDLENDYKTAGKQLFEGENAWVTLSKRLKNILLHPDLSGKVVVVDALDECTDKRYELLDLISSTSGHVKWLVSSRFWVEIEEKLGAVKKIINIALESCEDSVSAAVDTYIQSKVDDLAQRKGYNEDLRQEVEQHFRNNADNTFLWVAIACQRLQTTKKINTRKMLKTFPEGLVPLYIRMMEYVLKEVQADVLIQILGVLAVTYSHISLADLVSLVDSLADHVDDLEDFIVSCGSFLVLRRGIVYFVHLSAKDFLLCNDIEETNLQRGRRTKNLEAKRAHFIEIFPHGLTHQHRIISETSLRVLSDALRRDVYNLGRTGVLIQDVSCPHPDPLEALKYVSVYWMDHLRDSEDVDHEMSMAVDDFLRRKLLCWLEAMSLLRATPSAVLAIKNLTDFFLQHSRESPLISLLHEVYRFVLMYRAGLEAAPLQVYSAAISFCPTNSLIRKLTPSESIPGLQTIPPADEDWGPCLLSLQGHGAVVASVAYSRDGKWLASGSYDDTIKIWDATTGACAETLLGQGHGITSVAFSEESNRIASVSDDGIVEVWETARFTLLHTLRLGYSSDIGGCFNAFSANVQFIATRSASDRKRIQVHNILSGACVHDIEGSGGIITSVAYSHDGTWLASGSVAHTVGLLHTRTGNYEWVVKIESRIDDDPDDRYGDIVHSIAISLNGEWLAAGCADGTIEVRQAIDGTRVWTFSEEDYAHVSATVIFSANSQELVSTWYHLGTIKVWNVESGACIRTFDNNGFYILGATVSHDGQRVATGSVDDVKVWDNTVRSYSSTIDKHDMPIVSVVYSADQKWLASASFDGTVRVWDRLGRCMHKLQGHRSHLFSVKFSADGEHLASASGDSTVKVWSLSTGQCVRTLEGHSREVFSLAYSSDGHQLASGAADDTVRVWNPTTGEEKHTFSAKNHVFCLAYSANGQWLASGCGKRILIWNTTTGELLQALEGHGDGIYSVRFSSDNRRLVSSSLGTTEAIKVWDLESSLCIHDITDPRKPWAGLNSQLTPAAFEVSFVSSTESELQISTRSGILRIDSANTQAEETSPPASRLVRGLGLSADAAWITVSGRNILWVPPEYRATATAISTTGRDLYYGCASGRLLVYTST